MSFMDNTLKAYADNSKAMFDFWISFFPAAPMFGVEWRFGDAFVAGAVRVAPVREDARDADVSEAEVIDADAAAETGIVIEAVAEVVSDAFVADDEPVETVSVADAADAAVTAEAFEAAETSEPEAGVEAENPGIDMSALLYSEPPAEIDDLKVLKGVGPSLEAQLHKLGIYRFEQLAQFDQAQLEWLDENLNTVKGRCIRDDWAGQAKALLA